MKLVLTKQMYVRKVCFPVCGHGDAAGRPWGHSETVLRGLPLSRALHSDLGTSAQTPGGGRAGIGEVAPRYLFPEQNAFLEIPPRLQGSEMQI